MDKMQNKPKGLDRQHRVVLTLIALIAMISSFLPSQNPYAIISKFIETSSVNPNNLGTLAKLHGAYIYSKLIGWHLTPELIEELLYGGGSEFDFKNVFLEGIRQLYINKGFNIRERDIGDSDSSTESHIPDAIAYGTDMDRVSDLTQRLVDSVIPSSDTVLFELVEEKLVITYQVTWSNYSPYEGTRFIENELANSLGDFGIKITIDRYTIEDTEANSSKRLIVSEGQVEFFDRYDWTRTDRKIGVSGYASDITDALGIPREIFESLGIDITKLSVSIKDTDIALLVTTGLAHEFDLSAKFDISEFPGPLGLYIQSNQMHLLSAREG